MESVKLCYTHLLNLPNETSTKNVLNKYKMSSINTTERCAMIIVCYVCYKLLCSMKARYFFLQKGHFSDKRIAQEKIVATNQKVWQYYT